MISRKGQVALVLIFIVALVLFIGVLVGFYFSGTESPSGGNWGLMVSSSNFAHNYILTESKLLANESINCKTCKSGNLKGNFQELAKESDFKYLNIKNYFDKITEGDFEFSKEQGGNYLLSFNNVLINYSINGNSVTQKISFSEEFNSNGDFARFINN